MKNWLYISEKYGIRIMTSKCQCNFQEMLLKSADYQRPMEKMSWNVSIGVVLGQIVSNYTLRIVGRPRLVPKLHDPISTWLGLLGSQINRAVW